MQNYQNMQNMYGFGQMNQQYIAMARLNKEFQLCQDDQDLITIGCNFGLEENNLFKWKVTMLGPKNTPYEGGLFTISIEFPPDYPNHGPEFKFKNKIYHLNVVSDESREDFGHICINSINSWKLQGKVNGRDCYAVKQALLDIFCLFYKQGVGSSYDEKMEEYYVNNPEKFNEEARDWTRKFASM